MPTIIFSRAIKFAATLTFRKKSSFTISIVAYNFKCKRYWWSLSTINRKMCWFVLKKHVFNLVFHLVSFLPKWCIFGFSGAVITFIFWPLDTLTFLDLQSWCNESNIFFTMCNLISSILTRTQCSRMHSPPQFFAQTFANILFLASLPKHENHPLKGLKSKIMCENVPWH